MKTIPLRHVADVRTSSVDKHSHDDEVAVRLCNYLDVYKNDRVSPTSDSMVATATDEEVDRFRLLVGDTVLTKDSEDPFDIGISAYVDGTDSDFVCGYHLAIARPLPDIHPRYLTWALRSRPALHHFSAHASGISRYGLGISDLRSAPVPWWQLDQQRRIAGFLDDRVARIDQVIAARLQQRSALVPIRLETVLDDIQRAPAVPLRRLLSAVRTGGTPPAEADAVFGLPWYTPGAFGEDLELSEPTRLVAPESAVHFPAQTVLLVGIGATAGKVAWQRQLATGNQQLTCLVPDKSLLDGRFLLHQLTARAAELRAVAPSATLPIINNEAVKALIVRHASSREQQHLARKWDLLLAEHGQVAQRLEQSCAFLSEYKQSLITAAVTGELDVTTAGSGIPG